MDEAVAAVVTGTVVHVDPDVLVVPSQPPAAAAAARPANLADLRAGSASVLELHGPDLPPTGSGPGMGQAAPRPSPAVEPSVSRR